MNTARREAGTAQNIMRIAEKKIQAQTGMCVTLVLCPSDDVKKSPEQMMYVIANALHVNTNYYQQRGRKREIVELRFVAAILLRTYYPTITLKQIALLFGGQDHTSVMNALTRGNQLLDVRDDLFTDKYQAAENAVMNWMKAA